MQLTEIIDPLPVPHPRSCPAPFPELQKATFIFLTQIKLMILIQDVAETRCDVSPFQARPHKADANNECIYKFG